MRVGRVAPIDVDQRRRPATGITSNATFVEDRMTRLPVLDSTIQKTHEWLNDITDGLGFPNERSAFAGLRAILHVLRDRLPQENAAELGAELPMLIRGMYYEGWNPAKEPTRVRHQQEFFDLVAAQLEDHRELRDSRRITKIVFGVLAKHLSPGETNKILLTLPAELRELWMVEPPKVRVKEIMSKEATWVGPDMSLKDAATKMRDLDIGCLPVGQDDRLIGMITDRDIACRAVAAGSDPATTPISAAMSPGVTYCFDDQEVGEAARLMEQKQIHRLPVLNRQKRMVGMLSLGDIGLKAPHDLTGEVVAAISRHAT
jgi:CBS domain-containing protein